MKSYLMLAMLSLAAIADVTAQAATPGTALWAATPAGSQPVPNAPDLVLLQWSGAVPLKLSDRGKCLLVARRGPQIVAIELSPLIEGPKLVGWAPKQIDMNTATSKWGYVAPSWDANRAKFSNPATASIQASSKTVANASGASAAYANASASTKSWTNASVEAHKSGAATSESAQTVTVKGKTYTKYSHFEAASAQVPMAASDEYICQ
ncbi:MAG TPA: hypothetical protein VF573_15565 [Paraburkholderia sp.]|uniref:hypothetical protein n=1 Tax=Paraburkholderia sp. TaxID=1926495 RepID=UPI002ED32A06